MISVAFLRVVLLASLTTAAHARAKRVWAHYLPWYDTTLAPSSLAWFERFGWCSGSQDCTDPSEIQYSNFPLIGEYSQFNNATLEYHLLGAVACGMDGFIINWNPASDFQTDIIDRLFIQAEALNNRGANITLMISYDQSTTSDAAEVAGHFQVLKSHWANSSAYFRDDGPSDTAGQPVILFWSSSATATFSTAARSVFKDAVLLVVRNAVSGMRYSEANFQWVTPTDYYVADPTTDWGGGYFDDFDWLMARQNTSSFETRGSVNTLAMGSVWPGFDDLNVPFSWNGGDDRLINRDVASGRTMSLTWDYMLGYTPLRLGGTVEVAMPWVQVTTWNDWPEGTSIEPANETNSYGYLDYLITLNATRLFKGFANYDKATADAAARLPHDVYKARQAGLDSTASNAVDLLLAERYAQGRALFDAASGGGGGYDGVCYSSDSTVMRLTRDGHVEKVPLFELHEGHRILAIDSHFKPTFAEVVGIARSEAAEDYFDIVTGHTAQGKLKATMHHTFPACGAGSSVVRAMDIRKGDCLRTVAGQALVTSVSRVNPTTSDMTYSLEMKDGVRFINIGSVFTHAKASHQVAGNHLNADALSRVASVSDTHKAKSRFEAFIQKRKEETPTPLT